MTNINVEGRRLVKNNKIAEIGQGGAEYTAGTGIDITEDVISVDFNDVQEKLTAGSNITISEEGVISATGGGSSDTAFMKLDYSKCVITGPSALDQDTITAWIKTLPIFVSTQDDAETGINVIKNYLVNVLEFPADNIYTHRYPGSMGYEVSGYFALLKETSSSPLVATEFIIFTSEGRTGTNSLVNRTNRSATRLFNVNGTRWKLVDAQYKGTNTSLSAYTDPLGNYITVYTKQSNVDRVIDIETKDTTVNPIKNQFVAFGFAEPTGAENPSVGIPSTDGIYLAQRANNRLTFIQFADAPTVDGTYDLEATVSDGVVTYTWVART